GMGANVRPDMAEVAPQAAKVVVVDKVIDAASNSFRVRLELPNPNNQLPPGVRCKVDFDLGVPTADNVPAKPATRPSADNAPAKPVASSAADTTPLKPAARPSVAAAVPK